MSAPISIRLSDLCLSGSRIMAVVAATGYFDDSRTDGKVCAVAGFIGNAAQWDQFESAWSSLLERHSVPWLHMKEMADPNGHFKKWLPPHDHRDELKAFFSDVSRTINNCRFRAFGTIVRLRDLQLFNTEKSLSLDPYALAVYGCMALIKRSHQNKIVNLFFDRIEKVESRIEKARQYAESDNSHVGVADFIQSSPLAKKVTFRHVRPIQAADFLAWELRKHHIKQNEWWEIEDRPATWDDRFKHYQKWSLQEFGARLPPPRKSLNAVLTETALDGIVWDYRALNIAHAARDGAWA